MIKFLMVSIKLFIKDFLAYLVLVLSVLSFGIMIVSFGFLLYSLLTPKLEWLFLSSIGLFGFFLISTFLNRVFHILMGYKD